jgi:alkylation response protein AidB-like acyl-CoA dehydrogenase
VDLLDSVDEAEYRAEVRTWLGEQALHYDLDELASPAAIRDLTDEPLARAWSRALAEAGYAGITWPKQHGGRGAPHSYQAIFLEEAARAEAPQHLAVIGLGMIGPTIIAHGTPEQQDRFLTNILTAEEIWCQGFSEPGAGSDLAAISTRGEVRGDRVIVNGQKIWSSFAQISEWCMLLVRTDPESSGNRGLSMLLVDMKSPGVEVRPIRELTGDSVFNEVFFNDVGVPLAARLGEIGAGWSVAMTTLLHERATLGFSFVGALETYLRKLHALARERGVTDSSLLERLGREWVELQGLKLTNYRTLAELSRSGIPGPEGAAIKLRWSESNQRVTWLALEILGPDAVVAGDYWRYQQLRSRANTIEAGTSEILRSVIAERVLGLARSR